MKLIQHVLAIRSLIQQAFENRFDRLGLKAAGEQPIDNLPDDRQEARRRLNDIMANHLAADEDYAKARMETINECVFTLFNRIAAIKVMEDKELFPEIIRRRTEHAGRSFAHNAWLEEHPEERNAEREGLKHFLSDKFEELGQKLPIYRADYPYAQLPTADELFQIIEAFNAVELDADCGADIWKGDDILGWLYENFNAVEKQAHKDSGDKTEYDKVSLQSQVYTPKWVVKFLVDNTLVKQYLEMYPSSPLREKYLVANAPEPSPFPVAGVTAKKIEEMRLIDPACGSGNFLLYACGVFYDLYQDQVENFGADYSRRDIPKLILENNLYGVDLDERAAQLTQLSLYIKAWQLGGRRMHFPEHLNVVSTAFTLPNFDEIEMALLMGDKWEEHEMATLRMVWKDLQNAYKFGSLIRVEETFDRLLPVDANDMFAHQWKQEMFSFKRIAIERLRNQLANISSNPYSLSKVTDALTFLEILTTQFDVAVANPPYTDSADFGAELKEFIENNYKKPLKFNSNLYAAFIKRCCELTGDEGKVGMIHPHTFMFIKTFEDVRKFMIEQTHINVMVDYGLDRVNLFGPGILLDATFYTLDKGSINKNEKGIYFNITNGQQEKCKQASFMQAYADLCAGVDNDRVYHLPQSKLKEIESYPFIYWISDEFGEKFNGITISDAYDICNGISSGGNNEQFYRYFWEVNKSDILCDNNRQTYKWAFINKGGGYKKWYGNLWLVFEWGNNGEKLKKLKKKCSSIRYGYENYYFEEGLAFTGASSKSLSVRYQPKNCIFERAGKSIFKKEATANYYELLAYMNSTICTYVMDSLNPTVSFQSGDIDRIPYMNLHNKMVESLSIQCVEIVKKLCEYSIVEPLYTQSPIAPGLPPKDALLAYFNYENALLTQVLVNEAIINETVFDIYELSEHDRKMVIEKEGLPVGSMSVSAAAKESYLQRLNNCTDEEFKASAEVIDYIQQLPIEETQDRIDDFDILYQSHNDWEEFCIRHKMNPIEVWYQYQQQAVLPAQRTQSLAFELVTDAIRSVLAKDDDGIVPIIDSTGEEQMAMRIEAELIGRGYQPAHVNALFSLLGMPLDKYLLSRFFQQLSDHLNLFMYLPKTPFIWHISSGEHHALELYVSIYQWSRDNLYRLKSVYAGNRDSALRDRLAVLEAKDDANAKMEAEEVRLQLRELKAFCDKVDDLLASGYDPKLDDGVGKNIAPLQKRKLLSYEVLNAGQMKKYLNADW